MKYSRSESRGWVDLASVLTACGFDALVVLGFLALVDVVVLSAAVPPLGRKLLAIPLVVVLPGYALTAALFPRRVDRFRTDERHVPFDAATAGALLPGERLALSVGASLAVLPLLGLVHSLTGLGFRTPALLGTLEVFVLAGLLVGVVRRFRVPRRERVTFAPGTWPTRARAAVTRESKFHTALTVALVVAVLAATSGLSLALVAPGEAESYTTMTVLTETDGGDLVTDGYPEALAPGESASLVVGVTNHERARTAYTVVTKRQTVRVDGNTTTVVDQRVADRTTETVAAGETWHLERTIDPTVTGETVRYVYLLYRGDPAADPGTGNAYRYTHLSVNATAG